MSERPQWSRECLVKIGTPFKAVFDCSEVLAVVLLKLLPQYEDASVVRSRDSVVLNTYDIVVGVGNEYDPSRHRYDPHTSGFKESVSTIFIDRPGYDWTSKLSSAGLIYCHFGHEILRNLLPDTTEERFIDEMFKFIYEKLIKDIDDGANGVSMNKTYTDLSERVSRLNPLSNSHYDVKMRQFKKAMTLVREEFLEIVHDAKNVRLSSRDIVRRAIASRFEVDASGEIITLSDISHVEYFFELEKEMNVSSIKYIIFKARDLHCIMSIPTIVNRKSSIRINIIHEAVREFVDGDTAVSLGTSKCRMLLPKAWAGTCKGTLVVACGIEGAEFVRADRRLGAHGTMAGAVAMAREALSIEKSEQVREE